MDGRFSSPTLPGAHNHISLTTSQRPSNIPFFYFARARIHQRTKLQTENKPGQTPIAAYTAGHRKNAQPLAQAKRTTPTPPKSQTLKRMDGAESKPTVKLREKPPHALIKIRKKQTRGKEKGDKHPVTRAPHSDGQKPGKPPYRRPGQTRNKPRVTPETERKATDRKGKQPMTTNTKHLGNEIPNARAKRTTKNHPRPVPEGRLHKATTAPKRRTTDSRAWGLPGHPLSICRYQSAIEEADPGERKKEKRGRKQLSSRTPEYR
ncbi:hypothetical protein NDU88_002378 [Pleurodeles waltl]|uniref:Uncharacterized protein n=1 Tax=Pleurodeles waltl TaxID=8319 RepID=A0AAV7W3V3_PLEWA|nr:hypothetical protein NDU88_002378 [Pleurodeles waltl]